MFEKCYSQAGRSRSCYTSEAQAAESAAYQLRKNGMYFVPYHCHRCGSWHLSPLDRQTPSEHCSACGKELYHDEDSAQRRADILGREQGVWLRVYECPHQPGWHLTSRR